MSKPTMLIPIHERDLDSLIELETELQKDGLSMNLDRVNELALLVANRVHARVKSVQHKERNK